MKTGDRFRCPDMDCGCEIEVKKTPKSLSEGEDPEVELKPSCFCGEEMELVSRADTARA